MKIFTATFWLIVVYSRAVSAFTLAPTVAHLLANLLIVVVTCAASTASCLSSTTTGGGAATPTPDAPAENDGNDRDYCRRTAAARVGRPGRLDQSTGPSHSATPPLFLKFDVQNITFNK